jgi:uncharacterized protein (TIGR00304 family)
MQKLIVLGILIIIIGYVVLFTGTIISFYKQGKPCTDTTVKAGGVLFIGPIPVLFGNDRTLVFISVSGALLFILAYLLWRSR